MKNKTNAEKDQARKNETALPMTLNSYFERFILECQHGRLGLKSKKPYARNTIEMFRETFRVFEEFQQQRMREVNFDDVTPELLDDMAHYLLVERAQPRQVMKRNSVHRIIGVLKIVLRTARREKLHDNRDYEEDIYSVTREEVTHVYLTREQIDEMYHLDFNDRASLERLIARIEDQEEKRYMGRLLTSSHHREVCQRYSRYRDGFVAGCLTGQRWSDYSRINSGMICQMENFKFIELTQIKTQKHVFIPMEKRLETILERNGGRVPQTCDYKLNKRIKEIALLLGWTHQVMVEQGVGPMRLPRYKRFCDCISSHTARRSWATNAYKDHVPLASIMAVTGHSTEDMLRKYLQMNDEEKGICAARDLQKVLQLARI